MILKIKLDSLHPRSLFLGVTLTNKGFTALEFLVAVGFIAMIIAIVLVALNSS